MNALATRVRSVLQVGFVLFVSLGIFSPTTRLQSKLWEFQAGGEIGSAPAIGSDGTIYFGALDGKFYALSASGTQKWVFASGGGIASSPAVGPGGKIYFGSNNRLLQALNPLGAELWSIRTGGEVRSSPAIGIDGTIYFGSTDGKVYAAAVDGTVRWQFSTTAPVFASPAVATDGTVYVGSRDGRFYAINPDGTQKWSAYSNGQIDASAAIGPGDIIVFGTLERRLYAFAPSGAKLWEVTTDSGFYSSPAIGLDGTVYAAAYSGTVYSVRPDGTVSWKLTLPARVSYSSVAVAMDGTIYVGAQDGVLYAINPQGTVKWTCTLGSPVNLSSPTLRPDGSVLIGTKEGKLYAISGSSVPPPGSWPMFRCDQRHTASGFVNRVLPKAYSPGLELTVGLLATPSANVGFYTVEDSPPSGWTVGKISHGGYYDSALRKIRFGPFLDGLPRQLTYTVTPPLNDSGTKIFLGGSTVDDVDRFLGGTHVLKQVPLHPADTRDVDGWITLGEMTAYGAAWKRGSSWPMSPSPIPTSYLLRAIELWSNGESYRFDTNYPAAPDWWVEGRDDYPGKPQPPPPQPGTTAPNGTAWVSLPLSYSPGVPFSVTIEVTPATNVIVYAIEHVPPAGWSIASISHGGFFDPATGKVKWGPFFDNASRQIGYEVTPPSDAGNTAVFGGTVAFDSNVASLSGATVVQPANAIPADPFATRHLPRVYIDGAKFVVTIETAEITGHTFYAVWDSPPEGWIVGQISDGGFYDQTTKRVWFGPFYDGKARVLSYEVTPPIGETGSKQFYGMFNIDLVLALTSGDTRIAQFARHPADRFPIDGWLAINEATAYAAAWKRGSNWVTGPVPITMEYMTKAIDLWLSGEAYVQNVGSEPFCWEAGPVSNSAGFPPPELRPDGQPAKGSASARVAGLVKPAEKILVSINVLPNTNVAVYAIEDEPPQGWTILHADSGGTIDSARAKVKWGPFFDSEPRTVNYEIVVPENAELVSRFTGVVALDGAIVSIAGDRKLFRSDADLTPRFIGVRASNDGPTVLLRGLPSESYVIEVSPDLQAWTPLTTLLITNATGITEFTDRSVSGSPQRFYRALW